jgi:hypothetical protein
MVSLHPGILAKAMLCAGGVEAEVEVRTEQSVIGA